MRERVRSVRSDIVTDDDAPWVQSVSRLGVIGLRDELLSRGISPAKAAGIAVWLDDQLCGRRYVSGQTARIYRRELRQLAPPELGPKIRAIPGYISRRLVAA
ncbi:MAG: hypothetical protein ACYDDZ_11040 [Acidimicrobiales bacterium]